MPELCLSILCPAALEEKLLDLLLLHPDLELFTSTRTAAHGHSFGALSSNEQVLGHTLTTQVQVFLAAGVKETVLQAVRGEFGDSGLRYWITPVMEAGSLV